MKRRSTLGLHAQELANSNGVTTHYKLTGRVSDYHELLYHNRRMPLVTKISLSRRMTAICFQWFSQMLGRSAAPGGTIYAFVTVENHRRLDRLPRSRLYQCIGE